MMVRYNSVGMTFSRMHSNYIFLSIFWVNRPCLFQKCRPILNRIWQNVC